jgi:uncharacterized phage protein (TIGR01671 family)
MREILFRGKTEAGKWVEGSLLQADPKKLILPEIRFYCEYEKGRHCLVSKDVIPETIGQHTGLTDKNGQKIFEGDIVRCKYANVPKNEHIQKVVFFGCKFMAEFSNGGCYAELYDGAGRLPCDKSAYMTEIEVIGNIHDNPELLGDK